MFSRRRGAPWERGTKAAGQAAEKGQMWHFFETLVPPFPRLDHSHPPTGLIRFIFYYSRGLWKFIVAVGLLNSALAAGEALFFVCMGRLVDWTAASVGPSEFWSDYGGRLAVMLLLAGVLLPLAALLHSLLLHQTISSNFPMQIRWRVHSNMLEQSLAFFTDEFAGRVANKVMQTALAVRTAVLKLVDVMVHMAVYIATMLWMLWDADALLTTPLVIWLVLYLAAISHFLPKLRKAAARQADARSDMVGRIVDSYVNISTVKLFGGRGREASYAKDSMKAFIGTEYAALRILTMYDVSVQFMNYLLLIGLAALSLALWSGGAVTSGSIAIAVAIAIRIINMSRWMMWEVGALYENIGTVYDGMHTITRPISVQDPSEPVEQLRFHDKVSFKNVEFAYPGGGMVFRELNFEIRCGEKLGIVGPSGAGKTTLVNLLLRFYDVDKGAIELDGVDIRSISQDLLRDQFAMVAQDPALMHRTVGENICYGSDSQDVQAMERAARLTDSLSFIANLSDYRGGRGFGTMVGERGVKLSGGQRQRIALARVLMRNAPILILDEATSALDSESESVIQENLLKVMEQRTVVAIAHRLSTLTVMDRILVLDHGEIVEEGTHEELLKIGGVYFRLWQRQSGGFLGL